MNIKSTPGTPFRRLYIIAGPPGSGKSILAHLIKDGHEAVGESAEHFEADMFFIDDEGQYQFQPAALPRAHAWCQDMVRKAMAADTPVIVVANTFTKAWEREPYCEMAGQWGYEIAYVRLNANHQLKPAQLFERNIHAVPLSTIERMVNTNNECDPRD